MKNLYSMSTDWLAKDYLLCKIEEWKQEFPEMSFKYNEDNFTHSHYIITEGYDERFVIFQIELYNDFIKEFPFNSLLIL